MPTKKPKNGKPNSRPTMTLTRETSDVTQYPADTSGRAVSQLTRIETPMKKLVSKKKPKSGYGRIDF